MLSREDIDRIESYLFNASLQDVPKVFGQVLPLVFAELRTMQIALDQRAEDFFSHEVAAVDAGGRGHDRPVGSGGSGPARGAAGIEPLPPGRDRVVLAEVPSDHAPTREDAHDRRDTGAAALGAVAMDPGRMLPQVGGPLRGGAEEQPSVGSEPVDAVVKRKRGRPRKVRE